MKKNKFVPKHILFVTGELSGDLHAGMVAKNLKKIIPHLRITATGGPSLKKMGAHILADIKDLSVVGFAEVFKQYGKLKRIYNLVLGFIRQEKPDLIICVDYPGFNLKLAKDIHPLGIPVIYYISPQIWAWKYGRIRQIKKYVTEMIVILPFEVELYKKEGVPVRYFGHPLANTIALKLKNDKLKRWPQKRIVFLPGSRHHEVHSLMPMMVHVAKMLESRVPGISIGFACADTIKISEIDQYCSNLTQYSVIQGQTYEMIKAADLVITASGTASLEVSLFECPVIVVYNIKLLSYIMFKLFIKIKYISLTNIILNNEVIKEFLAPQLDNEKIFTEAIRILEDSKYRKQMITQLHSLRKKLERRDSYMKSAAHIAGYLD